MSSYGFHSEAADEYLAATRYYLNIASPLVAAAFVGEVEVAIQTLLTSPTTWPVIEEPQIRATCSDSFHIQILSLGTRAKAGFHLRRYASQQASRLLAPSH